MVDPEIVTGPLLAALSARGGNRFAGLEASMRILLIEDHKRLAQTVIEGLAKYGFRVDLFTTVQDGLIATRSIAYDALILDLGLPDGDGLDVVCKLRAEANKIPILILTARDGLNDRVAGLDSGADDYMLKPLAMKELAARLRALLRRNEGALDATIDIANLSLDRHMRQIKVNGQVVAISRRELDALGLLMRRVGQVVPKRLLEDMVYGLNEEVMPNTIEALVSRLRRRLESLQAHVSIHTLRGIGYLLTE
jgi:DNA-binding response OmpR family regulator